MRALPIVFAVWIVALACAAPAPAQAQSRAQAAYVAGDFMAAAARVEAVGGDRSLAARALLAAVLTGGPVDDVDALIARAEAHARAGAAADPDDAEPRLHLALALGMKARRAPLRDAVKAGYAREGRALIDAALRLAPASPWAHALDGAWHLEILRRGGRVGASLYGAERGAGLAAFERARALAPGDAAIAYQYAVALLELDGARGAARARALLAVAGACRADDAFEAAIAAQARQVAQILDTRGPAAAARDATRALD
ncbi:MAG: hypothetical protein NW200_01440 [Hyphomonadaceae bacterium]|nr:hypothetical protein [Hyphomonadaceae bacterium]